MEYLVVSLEAANHGGDLVDQAEIMDQVLQVLVQLTRAHVQFIYTQTHFQAVESHQIKCNKSVIMAHTVAVAAVATIPSQSITNGQTAWLRGS